MSTPSVDVEVADALRIFTPFRRESEDEIVDHLLLVDLGEVFPANKGGNLFVEFAGSDSVGEGAFAVDLDAELGNGCLLLNAGFFKAWDLPGNAGDFRTESAKFVQVGPEDLDGNLGRYPAEHMPDAVGEGTTHGAEGSGDAAHRVADFVEYGLAGTS